jgi:hypothetical protein
MGYNTVWAHPILVHLYPDWDMANARQFEYVGVDVYMREDNHNLISWPWAGIPIYWQKACNTVLLYLLS